MSVPYRPKHLFQSNSVEREAWQQMANNPILQRAIAYAQAEMAWAGFGPLEMTGANFFIIGLLNLSENEEVKRPIPMRQLTSYDPEPPKPVTPKQ